MWSQLVGPFEFGVNKIMYIQNREWARASLSFYLSHPHGILWSFFLGGTFYVDQSIDRNWLIQSIDCARSFIGCVRSLKLVTKLLCDLSHFERHWPHKPTMNEMPLANPDPELLSLCYWPWLQVLIDTNSSIPVDAFGRSRSRYRLVVQYPIGPRLPMVGPSRDIYVRLRTNVYVQLWG